MYFKLSRRWIDQRKARLVKKGMRRKKATARFMVDQATGQWPICAIDKQNLLGTTCHHQSKRIDGRSHRQAPNVCIVIVRNNARIKNPTMPALPRHSHGWFHWRQPDESIANVHPNAKINGRMPSHRIGRLHYRILSESDDIVRPNEEPCPFRVHVKHERLKINWPGPFYWTNEMKYLWINK
jgi:hypothetical protein